MQTATEKPQAMQLCPECGHDLELHSPVTQRCVVVTRRWHDGMYVKKACRCGEEAGCR